MTDIDMPRLARTLSEMAHALASADEAPARVRRVLSLLTKVVPYDQCALIDAHRPTPEIFAVPDLSPSQHRAMDDRLHAYFRLINGVDQESAAPTVEAGRTHLAIPVAGVNEMVGVLLVERSEESYDEQSVRILSIVAAQLGAYLTALRLRHDELEHARQLATTLHRLQETDRRKDEFLAMLGHELRNPLGAINFALRIIDRREGTDPNAKYHQVIDRQITHLSRIVDELLDASRVRLGKIVLKRERVDLCSIARRWLEAFGMTARVRSHDVHLAVPEEPVDVDGDPVRLEQVFSNLLTNALKFTPPGGQVHVTVAAEGDRGVLRVRDSGVGMTPEVLANAFDLFMQADDSLVRSEGGIGLGLSLVRTLVEKHGGTIDGSSEGPGRGSEFVVRLPLLARAGMAIEPPRRPVSVDRVTPLSVLVIEDNDDAREMLVALLASWGHRAFAVGDGLDGVTTALRERPDAAVVDIGLPGLNGFDVARRIRQDIASPKMMLIAMTGFGRPEDRRRAIDAGFDAYLVKPVDHDALRAHLATVDSASAGLPIETP